MRRRSSWGVTLVGAGALAAATMISTVAGAAAPAKADAKAAASKGDARATQETKAAQKHAHAKKVSKARTPEARHARHGKTTRDADPDATDEALAGETIGGGKHAKKRAGATASTAAQQHHRRTDGAASAKPAAKRGPCLHESIELSRGFNRAEVETLPLTRCDGRPAPFAVEKMSVLVRPMTAPRPAIPATPVRHVTHVREWVPGVKLVDSGLVTRLQKVVDHFHTKRVTVVSGYRPTSLGSFHQSARALDFHLDGISNEDLVSFCRTLADTGCGYYPNSSFVHMDVRAHGTGHVYWIDASGPGEPAKYVSTWPPKDAPAAQAAPAEIPRPDPAAPGDENTNADGTPELPPSASDAKVDATTVAPDATGGADIGRTIAP